MLIAAPCVVTLTWTLADAQGNALDERAEPTPYFYGGGDLLPKVEEALAGQSAGHEAHLHLEPEHAFGDYLAELVCFEPRSVLPEGVEVGMTFEGLPPGATSTQMPADRLYTVTEIYPEHVVLDGNHPLAGMALHLTVKVVAVRAASPEEVAAGSVGGEAALTVLASAPGDTPLH